MSDRPTQEGWAARARASLITMVAVVASLVVVVTALGRLYDDTLRPRTQPPVVAFPKPELERVQTPPDENRVDYRQSKPTNIDRAMAETAREGNALWRGAKP